MLKPPRAHNFNGTLPFLIEYLICVPAWAWPWPPRPPRWVGGSACRDRYRLGFWFFWGGGEQELGNLFWFFVFLRASQRPASWLRKHMFFSTYLTLMGASSILK
uniref:Uncharacterized protein n=1 Tax=Morchella importuna TaxID=1174673 RepID=A0A650AFL1_9PEZI|nr:hypothetical protein [Morchella importuna]QGN66704.1 hypothetical protein [Morchella importuna]